MMEQYARIKAEFAGCLLLFRMGDFYETFYEDAELVSRELGLVLTSRDKAEGPRIPLAGIPWHALDGYLARLVRLGHRVAICDQVEEASQAKGLVRREVVRVVTPGTLLEGPALEEGRNNYLVAVGGNEERIGLARVDLSTGEFEASEFPRVRWNEEVRQAEPSEILLPRPWAEGELGTALAREHPGLTLTPADSGVFLPEIGRRILLEHFRVASLEGYGLEPFPWAVGAAGAILHYLRKTRQGPLHHMTVVRLRGAKPHLELDESALRHLEVLEPLRSGDREATLLGVMDHTVTPMGSRLLRRWLREPLREIEPIEERLDAVEEVRQDAELARRVMDGLSGLRDLERLVGRLGCERATPRDLAGVGDFLRQVPQSARAIASAHAPLLRELCEALRPPEGLAEHLARALVENPPVSLQEGGIFRDGYHPELDELRRQMGEGRGWVASLQERERRRSGIPTLKVGFNRVFGYYLEVTRPHLGQVPPDYERRQTLVGAERFVTPDLKEQEARILDAEERAHRLEREIYLKLRQEVASHAGELAALAGAVARLDVLASFARAAREGRYVRPRVVPTTRIAIRAGRHPVVERRLAAEAFVPNDTLVDTDERQILLITGPNMAGKSTYLRQVALIVILAQAGSFVPAAEAEIGVVDRIFTRVGASDDLARGQSTFLVEMQEVANILNNATPRSLLLLDEVGRGTSTFDGLSIAWAMTEHLHEAPRVRARCLFATHYHELTELARQKERVVNLNVAVREWDDRIVFLREIRPGASDQSYGIQVARLAGLPREVLDRAREVLVALEEGEIVREALLPRHDREGERSAPAQLNLFGLGGAAAGVVAELAGLDLDGLTPREALDLLSRLKKRIEPEGDS